MKDKKSKPTQAAGGRGKQRSKTVKIVKPGKQPARTA